MDFDELRSCAQEAERSKAEGVIRLRVVPPGFDDLDLARLVLAGKDLADAVQAYLSSHAPEEEARRRAAMAAKLAAFRAEDG